MLAPVNCGVEVDLERCFPDLTFEDLRFFPLDREAGGACGAEGALARANLNVPPGAETPSLYVPVVVGEMLWRGMLRDIMIGAGSLRLRQLPNFTIPREKSCLCTWEGYLSSQYVAQSR